MPRKPDRPAETPAAGLQHNPFGALAALAGKPAAPAEAAARPKAAAPAPAPEPARPAEPARAPAAPKRSTGPDASFAPVVPGVKSRGRLVLRRETRHRGGKPVIVVCGAGNIDGLDVAEFARELKRQLGCGGTVDENDGEPEIILSGDRPAKVAEVLRARNFRVDGVTG